MVVAFLGKLGNRGIILASTGSISGILLIAFSLVGNIYPVFWIGLLGMVLMGLIQAARMTFTNSLMVEYSDETFRGRVMSIQGMGWSLMPGAVLPITLISQYFSIEIAILFMGLALTTISLLVLFFNRSLKLLV